MGSVEKLTAQQIEIVARLKAHSGAIHQTKMGFEINGRYLCDLRTMRELVRLKVVESTYVDASNGSRVCVYRVNRESPITDATRVAHPNGHQAN